MLFPLLSILALFLVVALGLAWPLATRLKLEPVETLLASAALSLVGVYLVAWTVYVLVLPLAATLVLPFMACGGLAFHRETFAATFSNREVRSLLTSQLLVTAWCIGALALVISYSGGGWAGDWFGHWQRVCFFLEHGPLDLKFNGFDPVTSRPPLANVVGGFFLIGVEANFAHYQFISTLFSTLAFLPAAVLARRFGGSRAVPVLVVLLMVSPLFLQNATFAWTKLPAAFFALSALYFFLRAQDPAPPHAAGWLFATTLAAGLLTHYSVGPYALLLAAAWLAYGCSKFREPAWWRVTGVATLAGAVLLSTWFAWTLAVYGVRGTFLTNTSVTEQAPSRSAQFLVAVLNVRDTLVPHFLRSVDPAFISQRSPWGWWRDWFFQLYQVNFFFAFGSVAWIAILAVIARDWTGVPRRIRSFWSVFVAGGVILGVMVHGARDTWGLAHICLQPLVLLGLAFLAARWPSLTPAWRRLVLAGATLDFMLGVALQFGVESRLLDRWLTPNRPVVESSLSYSQFALMNLRAKLENRWGFFGDLFADHTTPILIALTAVLVVALIRTRRTGTVVPP